VSREGYRIVQESLTNALRHAGDAPVTVTVDVSASDVTIEVANPLANGADGAPRAPGYGIDGMRERVTLLGGTLEAGPRHGAWQVRATLPVGVGG
jgi:signal transduction histidine kinase